MSGLRTRRRTSRRKFLAWLLDRDCGVAAASKEDGFVDIGGTSVSEREATAPNELVEGLRVET